MPTLRSLLLILLAGVGALYGQLTQLDLRMQSRDVDFSGASATKPFKSGHGVAVLPADKARCITGWMPPRA